MEDQERMEHQDQMDPPAKQDQMGPEVKVAPLAEMAKQEKLVNPVSKVRKVVLVRLDETENLVAQDDRDLKDLLDQLAETALMDRLVSKDQEEK